MNAPHTISQVQAPTTAADGPALKSPASEASNAQDATAHNTECASDKLTNSGPSAAPKKHAQNPLHWRICCPDCGWIPQNEDFIQQVEGGHIPFDCQRCKAHYATVDFEAEMDAKHKAQHHNHATADLESESLP